MNTSTETIDRPLILARLIPLLIKDLSLRVKPEELSESTILFGEGGLGLDSLDGITITLALEVEFGIIVEPEDVPPTALATIGSLCDYIQEQLISNK